MSLGSNVAFAGWTTMFRVRAFRVGEVGFVDAGMFPLSVPKVDDKGDEWLLSQMYVREMISLKEMESSEIEVFNGRGIVIRSRGDGGRRYMILMPL